MPIYEYACESCGKIHEVFQKFNDGPLASCPDCGGEVKKLISNSAFILRGTGWYKTDYASPDKKKAAEVDKDGSATSGKTSASDKTETKPETKTETKTDTKAEAA